MPLGFVQSDEEFRAHTERLVDDHAGGSVIFFGSVRKINQRKEVAFLEYEAAEILATSMFAELEDLVMRNFSVIGISACHRLGRVLVGQDAVMIQVIAKHRSEAFLAARFLIDELKKTLPIWKKEVYVDGSHSFTQTGCRHDKDAREIIYEPVKRALRGRGVQHALCDKHVVLIGAGGLGCPLAINLSALGIGILTIIDDDVVSLSNLSRQYAYTMHDQGKYKARLLAQFIAERNPGVDVRAHVQRMDDALLKSLGGKVDLIIDATDDAAFKSMMKICAHRDSFALISASVHQQEGEVHCFKPQVSGGCPLCFSRSSFAADSCANVGVFTHACQSVAATAAERALQMLTDQFHDSFTVSLVDPERGVVTMHVDKDPHCRQCSGHKRPLVRLMR